MRHESRINRQARHYPDCDKFHSDEGYDYAFFDDEPDYDEELDVPEHEGV